MKISLKCQTWVKNQQIRYKIQHKFNYQKSDVNSR